MDLFHKNFGDVFSIPKKLTTTTIVVETSDPYVTVSVGGVVIARTFVIENNKNPHWIHHYFNVPVAHHADEVHFLVKDNDVAGLQIIGALGIPVEVLYNGSKIEGFFQFLVLVGSLARQLVYNVGWSVYYNVSLVKGGGGGKASFTSGELLKAKSQEG
ncbi:hypothetical protein RIF29_25904 [Crotalaria pallida]|uniref:C2 domain-containing protein n=1 Tax=Crotalaria pallida TaxID=3830 RepID=A0AAN9I030_CROPI